MKRLLSLIIAVALLSTAALTGCSAKDATAAEQQMKAYQDENATLKRENEELKQFKERVGFSLFKLESTIFRLDSEGYLPMTGSQVNAPELFDALKEVKDFDIPLEDREIALSMMPQQWSGDFGTILFVYDVYKPVLNGTDTDSGKVSSMAGIFKKTNDKWELMKFTREFKGDESFSINNL